jgi:hypothetical protein
MSRITVLLLGLILFGQPKAGLSPEVAGQEPATQKVLVITVRPTVTVQDSLVPVGTVATLSGGTHALRKKVAELDLVELTPGGSSVVIGKDQISIRLQIAGIDRDLFQIEGKKVVVTPASQELTEETLVATASQLVRRRLPRYADDVNILLAMPVKIPNFPIGLKDRIHLEAEFPPGNEVLGLIQVTVAVFKNGERLANIPVCLNVSYLQRASAADMEAEAARPILIKGHDMVRLVARIGRMRIMARGEALQEGRLGEVIRVRNVDSDKIVSGRIAEAGMVEVDY